MRPLISEKAKRQCLKLIQRLSKSEPYQGYLQMRQYPDFNLACYTKAISFDKIKKKIEERNAQYFEEQFYIQLKTSFTALSEYLLKDDPLQKKIRQCLKSINRFQDEWQETWKRPRGYAYQERRQTNTRKAVKNEGLTALEILETVCFFRSIQDNPTLIREIAIDCDIINENDQQISLNLNPSEPQKQQKLRQYLRKR